MPIYKCILGTRSWNYKTKQ